MPPDCRGQARRSRVAPPCDASKRPMCLNRACRVLQEPTIGVLERQDLAPGAADHEQWQPTVHRKPRRRQPGERQRSSRSVDRSVLARWPIEVRRIARSSQRQTCPAEPHRAKCAGVPRRLEAQTAARATPAQSSRAATRLSAPSAGGAGRSWTNPRHQPPHQGSVL